MKFCFAKTLQEDLMSYSDMDSKTIYISTVNNEICQKLAHQKHRFPWICYGIEWLPCGVADNTLKLEYCKNFWQTDITLKNWNILFICYMVLCNMYRYFMQSDDQN